MSSIPADWWIRRFVEGHVEEEAFNCLPIPATKPGTREWKRAVFLAGRLAACDGRFSNWAEEIGVSYGPLQSNDKDTMIAELDAVVAHLYGLSEQQLRHIFETFHEGWDYKGRLNAVLKHFRSWGNRT
jgi:hypothetical protein